MDIIEKPQPQLLARHVGKAPNMKPAGHGDRLGRSRLVLADDDFDFPGPRAIAFEQIRVVLQQREFAILLRWLRTPVDREAADNRLRRRNTLSYSRVS